LPNCLCSFISNLIKPIKFFFLLLILDFNANSQNTLIGTKAPEITPEKWIYPQGAVNSNEAKDYTVVDFWFTKCAPCVATIPELNSLSLQNPNIRFLSITFNDTETIKDFIEKVPMYYPVGIDIKKDLINKFQVVGYPKTFIIDKNGIIVWQGHPINISSALAKLSNEKQNNTTVEVTQEKEWNQGSSYSMNIKEHAIGMGKASSLSIRPFDITLLNRSVKSVLNDFYNINNARIIIKDTSFLDKSFDVQLKLNKEVVESKNSIEIFKFHYLNSIGVEYEKITKYSMVHELIVSDNKKLDSFSSNEKYKGTTIRYDNWEAKGMKLEDLKNFLENNYNIVVELNDVNNNKYDFILPINNLEKTILKLQTEYGIIFKERNQKTYFYEFKKK